jgi:GNAT superfamily N-acetyltransferase
MPGYRVRPATLADVDVLAHHRIGMFADMGTPLDASVEGAFRRWLAEMMPEGIYQAWLVETDAGDIVAGGGMTILPWPPGPHPLTNRIAFVYNVYTERSHRRRGLARRIMETIHEWCRANRIGTVLLNASQAGQPLYESMGYRPSPSVMMVMTLEP